MGKPRNSDVNIGACVLEWSCVPLDSRTELVQAIRKKDSVLTRTVELWLRWFLLLWRGGCSLSGCLPERRPWSAMEPSGVPDQAVVVVQPSLERAPVCPGVQLFKTGPVPSAGLTSRKKTCAQASHAAISTNPKARTKVDGHAQPFPSLWRWKLWIRPDMDKKPGTCLPDPRPSWYDKHSRPGDQS